MSRSNPIPDTVRLARNIRDASDPDACWEWTGYRTIKGYGILRVDGRKTRAHRLSWVLHHGPIPDGMLVCHRCDNPSCVNPGHLFLGTEADNSADKAMKGRSLHSERNPKAKITAADSIEIRRLRAAGVPTGDIARRYGIVDNTVREIVRGERWRRTLD